jgi:hypothetical protein
MDKLRSRKQFVSKEYTVVYLRDAVIVSLKAHISSWIK